jgi:uncharacterized Zn-finger protein
MENYQNMINGYRMSDKNKQVANSKNIYYITPNDFPLSCPGKDMQTSNSHPKVYIKIDKDGEGICPYCGAIYRINAQ